MTVTAVTAVAAALVVAGARSGRRKKPEPTPPPPPRPPLGPSPAPKVARRSTLIAGVAGVIVLAVAIGLVALLRPESSSVPAAQIPLQAVPSMVPSTPALPVPGGVVPIGTAVTIDGHDGVLTETTLLSVQDLSAQPGLQPGDGYRLVAARVRIHNIGTIGLVPHLEQYSWLSDTDGHWFLCDAALTQAARTVPLTAIDPQFQVEQLVVFQVSAGARITRFRFSERPNPGETEDWTLV